MIQNTKVLENFKNAEKLINSVDNIVLIPHHNADGDAVGSSQGLAVLLRNKGKNVKVVSPNKYPEFLNWMNGDNEVIYAEANIVDARESISSADLIIMVDYNGLGRIGNLEDIVGKSKAKKILIDHHPYPEDIADIIFSDTTVSSAAELVYEFILGINCQHCIDKRVAECLYSGILTDTGSFSFNSSNPRTFIIVAELLSYGINKDEIFSSIYDNFSTDRYRLLGHSLKEKMVILPEFRTGYIYLSASDLKKYHFKPGDIEGFVNYPLSVKGIIFSALFVEKEKHIKLSMRSKGSFPVNNVLAKHFTGGGHTNAAGGKSKLSMDESIKKFINILPLYKDELFEV